MKAFKITFAVLSLLNISATIYTAINGGQTYIATGILGAICTYLFVSCIQETAETN